MKKNNKIDSDSFNNKITRKKAIKKAGVTVLTAASIMFLSTKAKASDSSPIAPGSGW